MLDSQADLWYKRLAPMKVAVLVLFSEQQAAKPLNDAQFSFGEQIL
jgi:hypothetical protein